MARLWRVHHATLPSREGEAIELDPDEAHHAHRVLRLREGEEVAVFDGQGCEWRAIVERIDARGVRLRLSEPIVAPVEAPIAIALWQGLCKPDRMDWIVQKATEVGVASIEVLATARSEASPPNDRRLARWRRLTVEAAKQSGRRVVPPVTWREAPDAVPGETLALVFDPQPDAPSLAQAIERAETRSAWVGVGPEGGLDPTEIEAWAQSGWRRARLGPRILRADTAGLVAASILLHRLGDLGS